MTLCCRGLLVALLAGLLGVDFGRSTVYAGV